MENILDRILATKLDEVAQAQKQRPLTEVRRDAENRRDVRDFVAAIRRKLERDRPAVIAEIKKASPSKGVLRADFDAAAIATSYAENGAACLSVLTDAQYFQGSLGDLVAARASSGLPVLRKDFVIDGYQIFQARRRVRMPSC